MKITVAELISKIKDIDRILEILDSDDPTRVDTSETVYYLEEHKDFLLRLDVKI